MQLTHDPQCRIATEAFVRGWHIPHSTAAQALQPARTWKTNHCHSHSNLPVSVAGAQKILEYLLIIATKEENCS